jgi:beta-lactamase family protein
MRRKDAAGNYNITQSKIATSSTSAPPTKICGITFEAFPVEHSILSPAVGYRVSAGRARIFYAPDLIFIHDRQDALKGVQVYIGDGATVTTSFIRRRGKRLIGHSPVCTQLTWCEKEGVPQAIISHCGRRLLPATNASYSQNSAAWPPNEVSKCVSPTME